MARTWVIFGTIDLVKSKLTWYIPIESYFYRLILHILQIDSHGPTRKMHSMGTINLDVRREIQNRQVLVYSSGVFYMRSFCLRYTIIGFQFLLPSRSTSKNMALPLTSWNPFFKDYLVTMHVHVPWGINFMACSGLFAWRSIQRPCGARHQNLCDASIKFSIAPKMLLP